MTQFIDTILEIITAAGQLDRFTRHGLHFSLKIDNPPFVPLVIEAWDSLIPGESRCISVAHYLEQGGDLVPDPEVEIMDAGWPIRASLASQALGYTQVTMYSADGRTTHCAPESRRSVLHFLNDIWSQNLAHVQRSSRALVGRLARAQRFVEAARKLAPHDEAVP